MNKQFIGGHEFYMNIYWETSLYEHTLVTMKPLPGHIYYAEFIVLKKVKRKLYMSTLSWIEECAMTFSLLIFSKCRQWNG